MVITFRNNPANAAAIKGKISNSIPTKEIKTPEFKNQSARDFFATKIEPKLQLPKLKAEFLKVADFNGDGQTTASELGLALNILENTDPHNQLAKIDAQIIARMAQCVSVAQLNQDHDNLTYILPNSDAFYHIQITDPDDNPNFEYNADLTRPDPNLWFDRFDTLERLALQYVTLNGDNRFKNIQFDPNNRQEFVFNFFEKYQNEPGREITVTDPLGKTHRTSATDLCINKETVDRLINELKPTIPQAQANYRSPLIFRPEGIDPLRG